MIRQTIGGRTPIYINADPNQAAFLPPGCISAIPVLKSIDNFGFPCTDPICYFYGATVLEEKRVSLYIAQLAELVFHIQSRRRQNPQFDGGIVVDFAPVTSKTVSDALDAAIQHLQPTHLIVVADDRLYNSLVRRFPRVGVVKLPMVPGAMSLSPETRDLIRSNQVRRYFYGDRTHLLPTTHLLGKQDVELYSLGPLAMLSGGLLPIALEAPDPKVPSAVAFGGMLEGTIMAIVMQGPKSEMWKQNVIGFVHVVGMGNDVQVPQINVLKPNHEELPSRVMIVSRVKWENRE
jgi:polyribonucleotide 5'-hydroxyl-kinase